MGLQAAFKLIRTFGQDESGATSIEYAFIGLFVAVPIVGGLTMIGDNLSDIFVRVREGFGN